MRRKHNELAPHSYCGVPGIVRYTISAPTSVGRLEVTCSDDEADAIQAWLREHGAGSIEQPMPVPEDHWPPGWPPNRWTVVADRIERAYATKQIAERARRLAKRRRS